MKRLGWVAILLSSVSVTLAAENWPQFRGPSSLGLSVETNLPVKWSSTANVRWKTPLPGPGHSSPIVWHTRVFVTAYRRPQGLRSYFSSAGGQLSLLALDRETGRIVWERQVPVRQIEETHSTNSPASPTPVTDGTLIYTYFGSFGLVAYDFAGNKVWEKPLGPFPNAWGSASSPVLYGNLLILNCDTDAEDFLLAVDKTTGKTVWRTDRGDVERSWPTPYIWSADGRDEIVVSGSGRVRSYDPKTGRELWSAGGLTQWVAPTPVSAHGLLFVASNGPGGNIIMAIRPGGRGDITRSHVAWRYDRAAPYVPSPVVVGDFLYTVKDGGVMTCLNARTGALVWQQRLPAGGSYYASLVAADGKIYATSEDGVVTVVSAKGVFEPLAANAMGERTMATPAIAGGRIYIRTDENLYAIGR